MTSDNWGESLQNAPDHVQKIAKWALQEPAQRDHQTVTALAEALDVSRVTVYNVQKDVRFRKYVAGMQIENGHVVYLEGEILKRWFEKASDNEVDDLVALKHGVEFMKFSGRLRATQSAPAKADGSSLKATVDEMTQEQLAAEVDKMEKLNNA